MSCSDIVHAANSLASTDTLEGKLGSAGYFFFQLPPTEQLTVLAVCDAMRRARRQRPSLFDIADSLLELSQDAAINFVSMVGELMADHLLQEAANVFLFPFELIRWWIRANEASILQAARE